MPTGDEKVCFSTIFGSFRRQFLGEARFVKKFALLTFGLSDFPISELPDFRTP
jgi:hypothetical protein